MLHDRVSLVIAYLDEVSKCKRVLELSGLPSKTDAVLLAANLPMDHPTLRQINALVASLPATATDDFKQESVQVS